ncbi:hypothetical protein K523DRAFT_413641 [Schizophyllum commune Tattone D]|nr:hypothetical protein K523DRAFT_413641 [Schizophyllum commune Tattone D]
MTHNAGRQTRKGHVEEPISVAPATVLAAGSMPCPCDLTAVQDIEARLWEPMLIGHIGGAHAHLLAALLPLVEDELRARARRRRKRRNSASLLTHNEPFIDSSLQSGAPTPQDTDQQPVRPTPAPAAPNKGPRPCVIWDLEGDSPDSVRVFLMGTFGGKPFDELAPELRKYISAVYTPALPQTDWSKIRHFHASPPWGAPSMPWIIPLPVDIHLDYIEPYGNKNTSKSVVADDQCHFINAVSLKRLGRLHFMAQKRMASTLSSNIDKRNAAKELLAHTNLRKIFEKGSIIYEHVQANQGAPLAYTSGPEDPQVPAATPRAPLAFPDIRTSQPLMSVGGASCTTVTTTSHLPRVNEQFELESFNAKVTETRMGAKAQATSPKSTASSSQTAQRPRRFSFQTMWSDVVKRRGR